MSFHILNNSALKNEVRLIQDKNTDTEKYRTTLTRIGLFMAYEVSSFLESEQKLIETAFGKIKGIRLQDENVIFITILRAAIPLMIGAIKVFPHAQCGMISARRILLKDGDGKEDAKFDVPIEYSNIPEITKDSIIIIPDPALASGSSIVTVLKRILKGKKPKKIIVLSVVCAKTGVKNILKNYPKAEIFTAHLGKGLNEKGFIVPDGPGDAGDRSFGLGNGEHV
jgi:uracil phosphoribosyltransferase